MPTPPHLQTKWSLSLFIRLDSAQEWSLFLQPFITSAEIGLSSLSLSPVTLATLTNHKQVSSLFFFLAMLVITLAADTHK